MKKRINSLMIKLIKKYQSNKTVIGTGHCRFYPSCSNYALEAYQKFNFFYATWLVSIRIIRCNPLARRRLYPLPLTKQEKANLKLINTCQQEIGSLLFETLGTFQPISNPLDYKMIITDFYQTNYLTSSNLAKSQLVGNHLRVGVNDLDLLNELSSNRSNLKVDLSDRFKQLVKPLTTLAQLGYLTNFDQGLFKPLSYQPLYPVIAIDDLPIETVINLYLNLNSNFLLLINSSISFTIDFTKINGDGQIIDLTDKNDQVIVKKLKSLQRKNKTLSNQSTKPYLYLILCSNFKNSLLKPNSKNLKNTALNSVVVINWNNHC